MNSPKIMFHGKGKEKRRSVAVLMGGPSHEHEVSIKSGKNVVSGLDRAKYDVKQIYISKKGEWDTDIKDVSKMADVAFIAMHGTYGEDGTVQALLEAEKIPYTGSNAATSALAMNKYLSLRTFQDHGFIVPHSFLVSHGEWLNPPSADRPAAERLREVNSIFDRARHYAGYPFVVKPNASGSSVAVTIVKAPEEFEQAMEAAFAHSRHVLIQSYVRGREVTCGVLDHGFPASAFALLPTEIIPRQSHFFDYEEKYRADGAYEITPARFPAPILQHIQRAAVGLHKALNCRGFSRSDFIVDELGAVVVLEINTIPGLTEQSLLPKAALAHGISFPSLLELLIEGALPNRF
ncbi:MAG: D-alanine--D-alanine ligase [Candidatus Jorgensenbacteria bacterium]|nr:D-alanine--D-alanine ligase [Candidatus Jorgensenbacteria bacterium]